MCPVHCLSSTDKQTARPLANPRLPESLAPRTDSIVDTRSQWSRVRTDWYILILTSQVSVVQQWDSSVDILFPFWAVYSIWFNMWAKEQPDTGSAGSSSTNAGRRRSWCARSQEQKPTAADGAHSRPCMMPPTGSRPLRARHTQTRSTATLRQGITPSTKCSCRGRKCVRGCQCSGGNTTDAPNCRKPHGRPLHPTGRLAHVSAPSPEILSEQNLSVHAFKKTIKTSAVAPGRSKSCRYL